MGQTLSPRRGERGVALTEVLVAVLILSTGLVGFAGLQIRSLSHNHDAYLRTQATVIAQGLADRMRANRPGVRDGDYHRLASAGLTALAAAPACGAGSDCDARALAAHDLAEWARQILALLPNGGGEVCIDRDPAGAGCDGQGALYSISVWWDDGRVDAGELPAKRFTTSFRP